MTNTKLLKALIMLQGKRVKEVADAIGVSPQDFSRKMHNKGNFTQKQIKDISEYLSLSEIELRQIFFSK